MPDSTHRHCTFFQNGFNYWFDSEETDLLSTHVDRFMVETREEQLIGVYFKPAQKEDADAKFLTVAEISGRLVNYGNIKKPMDLRNLGAMLAKQGFQKVYAGLKNQRRRGYLVREISAAEVDLNRKILAHDSSAQEAEQENPPENG